MQKLLVSRVLSISYDFHVDHLFVGDGENGIAKQLSRFDLLEDVFARVADFHSRRLSTQQMYQSTKPYAIIIYDHTVKC